jgi:hypothetical protein
MTADSTVTVAAAPEGDIVWNNVSVAGPAAEAPNEEDVFRRYNERPRDTALGRRLLIQAAGKRSPGGEHRARDYSARKPVPA